MLQISFSAFKSGRARLISPVLFIILIVSFGVRSHIAPIQIINLYCPLFFAQSDKTVSSLYNIVRIKCPAIKSTVDISIIFKGHILLNVADDYQTLGSIGMHCELNEIQVIGKSDFVALLETIDDIDNKENIPWFNQAMSYLSDLSTKQCRTLSSFGRRIHYDDAGKLIGIDLSHLNLTGRIHLESLPLTVRSLDLSFNDLYTDNLKGLRRKSLERLNLEHNLRCHIDTALWSPPFGYDFPAQILQISSHQIFSWITSPECKTSSIRNWMRRQQILNQVILDGTSVSQQQNVPMFNSKMLRVIQGVTNKEVIPWYRHFLQARGASDVAKLDPHFGIICQPRSNSRSRYSFNLSGLGLRGHIDLGFLPENVENLDISNNNLNSISFTGTGDGTFRLKALHLQNNEKLQIDFTNIDPSSPHCCLIRTHGLSISSNQLNHNDSVKSVAARLQSSRMKQLIVHNKGTTERRKIKNKNCG